MDQTTHQVRINFKKLKPSSTGLREEIHLALGAIIMLTSNIDVSDGLVNGVTGIVVAFDSHSPETINNIYVNFDYENVGKTILEHRHKSPHPHPKFHCYKEKRSKFSGKISLDGYM